MASVAPVSVTSVWISCTGQISAGLTWPIFVWSATAITSRAMQRQAREVIAVADHTKIGQVSPALICPVQEIHMLVTDMGATDEMIAPFEERGMKVLRV